MQEAQNKHKGTWHDHPQQCGTVFTADMECQEKDMAKQVKKSRTDAVLSAGTNVFAYSL